MVHLKSSSQTIEESLQKQFSTVMQKFWNNRQNNSCQITLEQWLSRVLQYYSIRLVGQNPTQKQL